MDSPVSAQQIVDLVKSLKWRIEQSERRYEKLQVQLARLEKAYIRHVKDTHRGWASMQVDSLDAQDLLGIAPSSLPPLRAASPDPITAEQGVNDVQDQSVSPRRGNVA